MTDGTVGPWAAEKLECLGKYLSAYTTVLRKQGWWCERYLYIDAFAGGGKAQLRQYDGEPIAVPNALFDTPEITDDIECTTDYVVGSPRVALEIKYPFSEYVFVEKSTVRISELEKLATEFGTSRNITIYQGDASEQILRNILHSGKYNWKKCRAVAFLDPFGMQVPWSTIEALGRTRGIELILNLPIGMAIQRLLPKNGEFSEEKRAKMDAYFGSNDWYDIVYRQEVDLFGPKVTKVDQTGEKLAKWYQRRLKEVYGFASKPRLIRNTRGSHLYYLLWAGPNKAGSNIAKDVLAQGEAI